MKRILAVLAAAAALLASSAIADTYYFVRKDIGKDTNDGLDSIQSAPTVGPWKTTGKANTGALAPSTANGDVVITYWGGGYQLDGIISPTAAPTDGKRYFIRKRPTTTAPWVLLAPGTITTPYMTVDGVTFSGDVSFGAAAKFDTLKNATVNGALGVHGNYSKVVDVTVTGGLRIGRPAGGAGGTGIRWRTAGVTFERVTALNGGNGFFQIGANIANPISEYTDSVTVKDSNLAATLNGTDNKGFGAFNSTNLRLEGNHWKFTVLTSSGTPNVCYTVRDSADGFVAHRDTVQTIGSHASIFFGQNGEHSSGSASSATLDSSYFHAPLIAFYAMGDVTARYSTFVGNEIVANDEIRAANLFDHCAFIGDQRSQRSVFRADGSYIGGGGPGLPLNIKNSIFYGTSPMEVKACDLRSSALYFGGVPAVPDSVTLNRNLYANFDYEATPGDKSIVVNSGCEGPGPGGTISPDTSFYGSPQFARGTGDSIPTFTEFKVFDANLGRKSRAIGNGFALSDIGPIDYIPKPALVVPTGEATEHHDVELSQVRTSIVVVTNAGPDSLIIPTITCVDPNGDLVTDLVSDVEANIRLDTDQSATIVLTYTAPSSGQWGHPVTRYLSLNGTNDPLFPVRRLGVYINPEGGGGIDPIEID